MSKTTSFVERFWEHVDRRGPDACWPWTGTKDAQGRAMFDFAVRSGVWDHVLAHRVAYELAHGKDIPDGWDCRQRCRNFLCVNPRHLIVEEPTPRFLLDPAAPGTFAADVEEWLHFLTFQGYAALTISTYASSVGKVNTWLERNAPDIHSVSQFSVRHVREFIWWLHNTKQANGTTLGLQARGKDLHALRSMLKYFRVHTDVAVIDHTKVFVPRMPSTMDRELRTVATADQVERMIDGCDQRSPIGRRDAAILALLFSSGLRVHELVGLNRATFPREELCREPIFKITVKGKGGHVRLIFVDARAQRAIQQLLEDRVGDREPWLFVNFRPGADAKVGGRLTPRGVQMRFQHLTKRAGLSGLEITPHSMRHGLAVDLLKGGADLRVVQDVLGHASIVTTQRYTKIENSHLEEGYLKRKSLQDRPLKTVH